MPVEFGGLGLNHRQLAGFCGAAGRPHAGAPPGAAALIFAVSPRFESFLSFDDRKSYSMNQLKLTQYLVASEPVADGREDGAVKRVVFGTRTSQARVLA